MSAVTLTSDWHNTPGTETFQRRCTVHARCMEHAKEALAFMVNASADNFKERLERIPVFYAMGVRFESNEYRKK